MKNLLIILIFTFILFEDFLFAQGIEGISYSIADVTFSPDGSLIATSSKDNFFTKDVNEATIKLWQVGDSKLLQTFEGHKDDINSISFSSDGRTLASGSSDKTIKIWQVADGVLISTLTGHTGAIKSVTFSPDGAIIASAGEDSTIRLWRLGRFRTLIGHEDEVNCIRFSPDGRLLASASSDGTIKLWNVGESVLIHSLTGHTAAVNSISFSQDGTTLISGSDDGTIRLWNISTGKEEKRFLDYTDCLGGVKSVALSPDGDKIASANVDYTVKIWRIGESHPSKILIGHTRTVNRVVFSPNGHTLATCADDYTIRIWQVENGQLLNTLTHGNMIVSSAEGIYWKGKTNEGLEVSFIVSPKQTVDFFRIQFMPSNNIAHSYQLFDGGTVLVGYYPKLNSEREKESSTLTLNKGQMPIFRNNFNSGKELGNQVGIIAGTFFDYSKCEGQAKISLKMGPYQSPVKSTEIEWTAIPAIPKK